jgi:hypothetical protein
MPTHVRLGKRRRRGEPSPRGLVHQLLVVDDEFRDVLSTVFDAVS